MNSPTLNSPAILADLSGLDTGTALVDPVEAEQEQWHRQRSGRFTCSQFGELANSGRGKDEPWSQTAWNYLYQIAAERCGSFSFEFHSRPTQWGKENEPQAIVEYSVAHPPEGKCVAGAAAWCEVDEWIGGTPDALLGADGCLEVKCPYSPAEHMGYVYKNKVPDKYQWQVIGHLFVTGRQWCDFVSFDPRIPAENPHRMLVVRTLRDDVVGQIDWLHKRLVHAKEVVQQIIAKQHN